MRVKTLAVVATMSLIGASSTAMACERSFTGCLPRVVVFPAYTAEGASIGVVTAQVHYPPLLQLSRATGQPLAVIYNNPGARPGDVDPWFDLVPLPHVPRSRTQGSYPVGY